jgi:taurine transport system substrate-binding protein
MPTRRTYLLGTLGAAACALGSRFSLAQGTAPDVVRLGWFGGPRPWILGKAAGSYDKALGTKVEWVQFPSGAAALTALASRQVDISRLGSPPTVAAIARGVPIEFIAISGLIATSERLIVRSQIGSIAELKGRKLAYPPGSTAHFALMAALKVNNVPANQVTLLGMAPTEMVAAWQRGDIDAAFVWGPFSHTMEKAGGKQMLVAADLQKNGYFVWNNYVVRKEFGEKHPDLVGRFLRQFESDVEAYKKDVDGSAKIIAQHLNQDLAAVKDTLAGLNYPPLAEQATPKFLGEGGTIAPAMLEIGKFLVELGDLRANQLPPSFAPFINTGYIQRALKR